MAQTKQQQIDALNLQIMELELKLAAADHGITQLKSAHKDALEWGVEKRREVERLNFKIAEMKKHFNKSLFDQASRLEAAKMFMSVMKHSFTHRGKAMFYEQAVKVFDTEIESVKRNTYNGDADDLPF